MGRVNVLLEFMDETHDAFARHRAAADSESEAQTQADHLVQKMAGLGLDYDEGMTPIPLFTGLGKAPQLDVRAFASAESGADHVASSSLVECTVDKDKLDNLDDSVRVWPNSELTLLNQAYFDSADTARADSGVDCRPYRPGAEIETIRHLLGIEAVWRAGFRGQNTVVGIIDEGVNGEAYPVIGGFSRPNAGRRPGSAPVTSHGSMCAADVLIAAPWTRLYDYPFLGVPRSGGALQMFQAVLNQRLADGTPHLTTNSYGFVGVPNPAMHPNHEVHDLNHPVHRKVREVVASGAPCFFAAGNCGEDCPSGACHWSGIGPGKSIHASNSLSEVITVAAVNSGHERIGYSSQGPGMFDAAKPDIAAYSHIFANYGPGRPAGEVQPFDSGTSAATPVAAGVGALLLSAFPNTDPAALKQALLQSAVEVGSDIGWNRDRGHGIVHAAAAFALLQAA